MPEAGRRTAFSPATLAELERFGFDDPYDPRFIWAAVFGTGMRGHGQRWPRIDFAELASVNHVNHHLAPVTVRPTRPEGAFNCYACQVRPSQLSWKSFEGLARSQSSSRANISSGKRS